MLKKLDRRCRKLKSIKKTYIDILDLSNAITELNNPVDVFNRRLYTAEEISKVEDR